MRTELSVILVAAGIVGTLTAGTVSANALMHGDAATAATAAATAPTATPVEVAPVPVTAPARTMAVVSKALPAMRAVAPAARAASRKAPVTYVVKQGDDLSSIAQWFALHGYADLFRANRAVIGDNPDLIFPGQRITISGGRMTLR